MLLSFKVPEMQKRATFEERMLITEERISIAVPEEIPSPEGRLLTTADEKPMLLLEVSCSKTKIKICKNFVLVILSEFSVGIFYRLLVS